MKKLNTKNSFLLILLTLTIGSANAFNDACVGFNAASSANESVHFSALKRQHLVVHHSSVSRMSADEYYRGQLALYTELCKTPYPHRDSLRQHGIEIHLVSGSIEQHPHIQDIKRRGLRPRNHDEHGVTWGDLPGVGSDGIASPVILDLLTLTRPISEQQHGSGSLVLHEFGHAVDFFFIKTGSRRNNISSTRKFKKMSEKFDWKIFIPDFDLAPVLTFRQEGEYFITNTGLYYREDAKNTYLANMEKFNRETSEANTVREEIRQYHAKNYEESFAELYARWYKDRSAQSEIIQRSPEAARYLRELDQKTVQYNIARETAPETRAEVVTRSTTITTETEDDKPLENAIEHENCELRWMNVQSQDLYTGVSGKMDYSNPNTASLLSLLRSKGYEVYSGVLSSDKVMSFSLKTTLKSEESDGTLDEIFNRGKSFLSPSNKIEMTISNNIGSRSQVLLREEKSFRRESLATNANYIYKLVDKKVPECIKK